MTCTTLVCLLLSAAPQGPRIPGAATPTSLTLPENPAELAYVPFRNGNTPTSSELQRFGILDLDGNHIADAFWLADVGGQPTLRLAMGREQSVGRFRDWPLPHPITAPIADAAAFRQAWIDQDALLLADPNAQYLTSLSFQLASAGDPHLNGWFLTSPLMVLPPSYGAVGLATANVEGDSCDDLAVVYDLGPQGHRVVKYRLDAPYGVPILLGSASLDVPWPVEKVRMFDYDGNGTGDLVADLPGLGVAVATDDGTSQLHLDLFVPAYQVEDLRTGRFDTSDAFALTVAQGVLVCWRDAGQPQWHWMDAPAGTTLGRAALLPRGTSVELAAFPADGRALRLQTLARGQAPLPPTDVAAPSPSNYAGTFAPCGLGAADLDDDGDLDLVLQHPDGQRWYTVSHEHTSLRPGLMRMTQDLSLVPSGWYGATYTVSVPGHWDLAALPQIELQVMVEHPTTLVQSRWDRRLATIDPATRTATFTVWWQDHAALWEQILANPGLVPNMFVQAGDATSGRRCQLNFLGIGPGNPYHLGGERRTAPLILFTDPGGNGNKSAQGIAWEPRTAPPLPKADDAMLPWQ